MKKAAVTINFRTLKKAAASGRFSVYGRTPDGTDILMPIIKPRNFTIHQLRKVMNDLKRPEDQAKRTG